MGCELEYDMLLQENDGFVLGDSVSGCTKVWIWFFYVIPTILPGCSYTGASVQNPGVCRELEIFLVVDECFLDFVKEPEKYSLKAQLSGYHNLFLLKAFTKRYAMAGVRLGYGICSENAELLEKMELWRYSPGTFPPWHRQQESRHLKRRSMWKTDGSLFFRKRSG